MMMVMISAALRNQIKSIGFLIPKPFCIKLVGLCVAVSMVGGAIAVQTHLCTFATGVTLPFDILPDLGDHKGKKGIKAPHFLHKRFSRLFLPLHSSAVFRMFM